MDPAACRRLIPTHEAVFANSRFGPDEDASLSHGSYDPRYQRNHMSEESAISKEKSIKTELTEIQETRRKKYLLLLGILAATITYQAGLNPPGGIWQDNSHGHAAGDPVLRSSYPRRYIAFFYCNTMAFVATLAVLTIMLGIKLHISKKGRIEAEHTVLRKKYLLLLATLAATMTYQAGLNPPGGIWQDNSHGHAAGDPVLRSSHPRRYKAFFFCNSMAFVATLAVITIVLGIKLPISREGSNKQRLADATAAKEQGRRHQMEKLRALLLAGEPMRGRHMARILGQTRSTLAPSGCFIVTLSLQVAHLAYCLHQDLSRSRKRFTYTVGGALLCTLQNVFRAIGIPPKAQHSVPRDSESTSTGNFTETEQENSSGSNPRIGKHAALIAVAKTAATWLVASGATHHATGNRKLLSGFKTLDDIYIQGGDGVPLPARGRGSVITDTVVLPDVMFVPGLTQNIVSTSQLIQLDCTVGFTRGVCYIRGAADGTVIGKAPVGEDGMFQLEFLTVPLDN